MPHAQVQHPDYKWIVVGALWVVCVLNYADRQVIFTVFPLLGNEFVISDSSLWVLSGSFMWMYALTGPFAGALCDRMPRRTLILGSLLFWSLTVALTSWAQHFWQLVAGVALGGLGEAFYFPSAMSMIGDYHGAATRSRAMSIHQSGVYVGSIVGGTIAGVVGEHFGWRLGFRAFGVVGIIVSLCLWFLLREPERGSSDGEAGQIGPVSSLLGGLREVAGNRAAWLLVIVFMGANFVAMIFTVWMPTFLFRKFHMSLSLSGLNGTAFLQIASVIGVVLGGAAADRLVKTKWEGRKPRMAVQAFGLICGVPFLLLSGWAPTVTLLLAAMVGFGFSKGVYDSNIWASLYDVIPIERRGAAVGVTNSLGWLGGAAAQLSIGLASARFGMGACMSATAAIYLCIGTALFLGSGRIAKANAVAASTH